MATCKDVAKRAGVSTATVTRAFESGSSIREETRTRILEVAREMNYVPDLNARSLKRQRSGLIGITVKDVTNPFYMNVVTRIEEKLRQKGYRAMISFADQNQHTHSELSCLEAMNASRVDGVIFSPESNEGGDLVKAMQARGTRFVQLYQHPFTGIDSICNDNEHGAFVGGQYLYDQGHRRVLLIVNGFDKPRIEGMRRAAQFAGIPLDDQQIIQLKSDPAEATAQIRAVLDMVSPSAIFAHTNYAATLTFRLLWDMGVRIPEDIALLIYDDLPWCKMLDISVITHPFESFAQLAVDLVLNGINAAEEPKAPQRMILNPFLLKRNSVRWHIEDIE